jgi:hypothetical protein
VGRATNKIVLTISYFDNVRLGEEFTEDENHGVGDDLVNDGLNGSSLLAFN